MLPRRVPGKEPHGCPEDERKIADRMRRGDDETAVRTEQRGCAPKSDGGFGKVLEQSQHQDRRERPGGEERLRRL